MTTAPARSAMRQLAATILVLEALVVGFAALAAYGLRAAPTPGVVGVAAGLGLGLLACAGLLRWRFGYVVGSVFQGGLLATGFAVPMMFFVGAVFAVLWAFALGVGGRIDRERAERETGAPDDRLGG